MKQSMWNGSLRRAIVASALLLCGGAPAWAGLIGASSSSPGELYDIDSSTGAATSFLTLDKGLSFTGFEILGGVGYATDIFNPRGGFGFGSIDLTTGAVTVLSGQDGSSNWWGLVTNPSGNFWTVDRDAGNLLKEVDPLTGATTTIGATGVANQGTDLAYDALLGILYAVAFDGNLYTIDTTTGASTLVGATGLTFTNVHQGLAFDPVARILYLNEADTFDALFTVNTTTGLATLVGSNGAVAGSGIDGLTYVASVPLPSSAWMGFSVVGLLLVRRRRHRRDA